MSFVSGMIADYKLQNRAKILLNQRKIETKNDGMVEVMLCYVGQFHHEVV